MKITLPNFTKNPAAFMRACGYAFEKQAGGEQAFVRRISGYDYPKFHAYLRTEQMAHSKSLTITIHIDQKKPSYGSHTAHSGEYDSELVVAEIERIKKLASSISPSQPKN